VTAGSAETRPASVARTTCRACGAGNLVKYLDLGSTPLANSYLDEKMLAEPEFSEELAIQLCTTCGLSQLTKVVNPDLMFRNYLYVSSTAATFRAHCGEFAETMSSLLGTTEQDLALDIASNDGCLLREFRRVGMRVVGVDPAENLAREANASGIPTICDYWSADVAKRIVAEQGPAKVVTATNVFAHVDDLDGFMRGIAEVLAPDGVFAVECPYVMDFIEHNEFDTAYHEHLSYIGVTPITHLVANHGMEVVNVEYFPNIHGGTIRVHIARKGSRSAAPAVAQFLERERAFGITTEPPYRAFAKRVERVKEGLMSLLTRLRGEGKTVWAYGASAKGNTLANYVGLTPELVPTVVDDNPKKWNLYTPGSHMHIVGTPTLAGGEADYLLLLAWNFKDEIMRRSRAAGFKGDFILPVPEPQIVADGRTA
jgi:SAM-dependent methyltransferase